MTNRSALALISDLKARYSYVLQHEDTSWLFLSDYKSVQNYISGKFPKIDLSGVNMYLTSKKAMEEAGLKDMGGCYIDAIKTIFVLDYKSLNGDYDEDDGKFGKAVRDICHTILQVEDVLVHEVMHAVSSLMERCTKHYKNAEEEFVYTHCVEFYRNKGISDEQIIDGHFLPFCLNDIMSNRNDLSHVFSKLKKEKGLNSVPCEDDYTDDEYRAFLDRHSDFLAPVFVNEARIRARHMIECYEKYGCRSASADDVDRSLENRFRWLNL